MVEIQKYDFNISTITPVHIGTGDVYMSSEYFMDVENDNSVFRRINLPKYFNSLNESEQNKLSKNLLNPKYKLSKISTDFERYYAYNRCNSRPNPGNEIHENIKVLDRPYIPGSSIKGAIENALLYNSLTLNDIDEICGGNKINENIIKEFFSPTNDEKNNIMRFLRISDSTVAPRPYIYDIQTIKVNKNKPPSKQMKLFYETILSNKLKSSIITNFDSKIFEDLNLENKKYLLDIDYIKESLYEFSKDYISHEIDFSKKYDINPSKSFYKGLNKKNSKDAPLLRLGSTTGILSSTINLKVKSFGFDYFNKVKGSIKGRKAKFDYPVSRRVLTKNQRPTGWVQLSFKEK